MSHEVENIFYVSNEENGRFKPWHGLGVEVAEALTSEEAIKVAGLDWTVEQKPLFTQIGDIKKEIKGSFANVRSSDESVLGIVSGKYKIVQNADAFSFTDSLIGEGCTYETAGSLKNGRKVFLLAKMPERKILDDDIEPFVCFTNTHDGTGAVRACMTPIRIVCNNTLNLALSTAKRSWSTRHMGDINSKLEEAKISLELANKYMDELSNAADMLVNTKVEEEEVTKIIDNIFTVKEDDSDRKKRNAQEMKDQFMVCMFAPDILKFKDTAWGVINAATDFADHSKPLRNSSTYQERNFNNILNGHYVVDEVFMQLLENRVALKNSI